MRRGNFFWGIVLILLGILFLLQAQGLLRDAFGWFWPSFLILLGLWIVAGRYLPRGAAAGGDSFSIDLQSAARLDVDFNHGAGAVVLTGGAPAGVAINGSQATGLEVSSNQVAGGLEVKINAGPSFIPFLGPDGGEWHFNLTREVPVALKVSAGASSLDFDLSEVKLTHLRVETGASTLKVKLPGQAGQTQVSIESGAATIELFVPAGVAARIHFEQGASSVNVDEQRFPFVASSDGLYQSADYDSAANKVEISLRGGANSVSVR